MVSAFSITRIVPRRSDAARKASSFFFFAVNALVAQDARPGRSRLWESFTRARGDRTAELVARAQDAGYRGAGIGTPDDMRTHVREFQARRRRPGHLPPAGGSQPARRHPGGARASSADRRARVPM